MKKIFAKELAALAVLAIAFTGCNTAFDGTSANFSEVESVYTDRSGVTQSVNNAGAISVTSGSIDKSNKRNEIVVQIASFSRIDLASVDNAIHFQQLSNNTTTGYYPVRGADLIKTRTKVEEGASISGTNTTKITYEVDGTGVTTDFIALFVDATKLKTKGGTPVLAGDGNLKRGEESDSIVIYVGANGTTTAIKRQGTGGVDENFCPTYSPIYIPSSTTLVTHSSYTLVDSSSKATGVTRIQIGAANKAKAGEAAVYEADLAKKLNDTIVLQYREPGKREYATKNLSFTYHDGASTTPTTDPYEAYAYTADIGPFAIGTEWRLIQTKMDGIAAPAWYKDVYGHDASFYYGNRAGAKEVLSVGTYTLHSTVPTYIVNNTIAFTSGTDASSSYTPTNYAKATIRTQQAAMFNVTATTDNWFEIKLNAAYGKLNPNACSDFIVVDDNNKKIDSEVKVVLKSYNDSTPGNGDVDYVKILVKGDTYRNGDTSSTTNIHVAVGQGTKIVENKVYPSQVTFGVWNDVADDDLSGYTKIN